jgi:hypothetical protein
MSEDVLFAHCALTALPKQILGAHSYVACGLQVPHKLTMPINYDDDLVFHSLESCFPAGSITTPHSFKYSALNSTWNGSRQAIPTLIVDFDSKQYIGTPSEHHCSGITSLKKPQGTFAVGNAFWKTWQTDSLLIQSFCDNQAGKFSMTMNDVRCGHSFTFLLTTRSALHDVSSPENNLSYMCLSTERSGHTMIDMRMVSDSNGDASRRNTIFELEENSEEHPLRLSGPVSMSVHDNTYSIFTTELKPSSTSLGHDAHFMARIVDTTTQNWALDVIDVQQSHGSDPILFASLTCSPVRHVSNMHVLRQTTIRHSPQQISACTQTHLSAVDLTTGKWEGMLARSKMSAKRLREPLKSMTYVPLDFAENGSSCAKMNYALINLATPERSILSKSGALSGGSLTRHRVSEDDISDFVDRVKASAQFIQVY